MERAMKSCLVVAFVCAVLHFLAAAPSSRMPDVTFDEIRMLTNLSCKVSSSCKEKTIGKHENFVSGRCECGPKCKLYDVCCLDSPHRLDTSNFRNSTEHLLSCMKIPNTYYMIYMISRCPSRWRGNPAVISKCQGDYTDSSDPYTLIPTTDNRTKTVYKNYFCGICNGVDPEELTLWKVKLGVDFKNRGEKIEEEELMEKLHFNGEMKKWGFWHGEEGEQDFIEVWIYPSRPRNWDRDCVPNLISKCDPTWKEKETIEKCLAYTSIVDFFPFPTNGKFGKRKIFKNPHCAICNNASLENGKFGCGIPLHFELGISLALTLIIDVNLRDGSKVGKVSRCPEGQSYDQFAKKCRSLVCGLPGYAVVGDRCVQV